MSIKTVFRRFAPNWGNRRHRSSKTKRGRASVTAKPRNLQIEQFEERMLLAITGPELVAVLPNVGEMINDGDVRDVAPREMVFRFNEGQVIDASTLGDPDTLGGIQIERSGFDGTFGDGNEVAVDYGWIGVADQPNEVMVRFAETLPDDLYNINIIGAGALALLNTDALPFNNGVDLTVEFELDLGAQVIAVVPQPVSRPIAVVTPPDPSAVGEGDQFAVSDGTTSVDFEFEKGDGILAGGTVPVDISASTTPDDVAEAIRLAVQGEIDATVFQNLTVSVDTVPDPDTVVLTGDDPRFVVGSLPIEVRHPSPLAQARDTVKVYFNDDPLDAILATDPRFYRLFDTAGTLDPDDDTILLPTGVTYDGVNNSAVLEFGANLPVGTYRLELGTSDESNETLATAVNVGSVFSTTNFSRMAFSGDEDGFDDVDLYRVEIETGGTFLDIDVDPDGSFNPAVRLFDAAGTDLLGFAWNFAGLGGAESLSIPLSAGTYYVGVSSYDNDVYTPLDGLGNTGGTTSGSYLIELGSDDAISGADDNSSFGTATQLGSLSTAEQRFTSQIEPQTWLDLPQYPGGSDEPGHRDIPAESHGAGLGTRTSAPGPIGVIPYNFASVYGTDSQGNTLYNQINEDQKDRAREIFEMYASLFGFEVRETLSSGIQVVTGDVRVLLPPGVPPGGVGGISGGGMVIMNAANYGDPAADVFGGGWMGVALHELGHSIGIMHSYDVRSTMGAGKGAEDRYPGQADVIHAQRINRPDAVDIDMYEFTVADAGVFTAETVAERLAPTSLLNTALRLYRQEDDGSRTLIAQNDDYFSNDSYIELALEPGTYFVGVSSTGNTDYDPTISDSGFGGLTDGVYDLKLGLAAAPNSVLMDDAGTLFDGDNDGRPGGSHEFFFRSANTIFVDKAVITNLRLALAANPANQTVRVVDVGALDLALSGNVIQIDNEQMLVTNVNAATNTFTVLRGHNSTAVTSHSLGTPVRLFGEDGSLATPYGLISSAVGAASPGDVIRIVGNAGADDDFTTPDDNRPYLIGLDTIGLPLEDGSQFQIPADVVVQIDAGAVFKLNAAVIDAGTSDQLLNRAGGALQVLGVPDRHVLFTSYADDAIGGDSNGAGPVALPGDWGGLVFRPDSDFQGGPADPDDPGIFLNYVNQAEFTYGGGSVDVDSITSTYTSIHIDTTRPTVTNNLITRSADAAMSANPDAFDDSRGRIGPTIHGNRVVDNTVNGIFVRIDTAFGEPVDRLSVTARFDDTDIVHVITESLEMVGNPGGPFGTTARPSGRLKVDPGIAVKLSSSRIEAMRGNSHLIAEGTDDDLVVFTSLHDDRFGAGGTFDTSNNGDVPAPAKGDWGGLIFNANSRGSIDRALIAYGGGETPIAGGFANFSTIEVHHNTHVRLANSTLTDNDDLSTGGNRDNRGSNDASLIFVRQAQPIIVNNIFENNDGNLISINANALLHHFQRDTGRSTGEIDAFDQFSDNHGPLVRLNRMAGNGTNGMNVRAEVLTNESVWDDTDIVHVLRGEIEVDQHHTYSGVRLQSAVDESLVVKLSGGSAGFTADGIPLDIDDRIGGAVLVVGQPGFPVVLTSLADDSIGASFDPDGYPQTDTNNDGPSTGSPGDWRSLLFEKYSNDRNVRIVLEPEAANNDAIDVNYTPFLASFLGELAPDQKSGDENRVLGFEVHGHISGDDPGDVDVYSFKAPAGTEVWIDVDRTRGALDTVVELVQSNGTLLARSTRSDVSPGDGLEALTGSAAPLAREFYNGGDYYTLNHHDAGFRVVLPGSVGQTGTYFVRVRSNSGNLNVLDGGLTSGEYQLQVRLQQRDEKPGSTVRYADIRYPTVGIDVRGLPAHSPLLGESDEINDAAASTGGAQNLGNLLESDINTISFSGGLGTPSDVDMYRFNVDYAYTELGASIQVIGGMSDGNKTWATVFDLDYADGLTRGDTTMLVFDANGMPILIGRESNITDDQPAPGQGNDLDDLTRGTVGKLDPFIGTVQLPAGTPSSSSGTEYYVAVSANGRLITDLNQYYQAAATNTNIRLEPINSVDRIIEDHIGFQGYSSTGAQVDPINTNGLFDITSTASVAAHVRQFQLADVALYVSEADTLTVVNPFFGNQVTVVDTNLDQTTGNTQGIQDIVFPYNGRFSAYRRLDSTQDSAGALVTVDPGTGALGANSNDNILGTRFAANSGGAGTTPNNTPSNFLATDSVDALTFDRTGFSGGSPDYNVYYAVRANDRTSGTATTSVLYMGREAGSATESTSPDYGIRGPIQDSGVNFASDTLRINAGADASFKDVRIVAKAPGVAGDDITVVITQSTTLALPAQVTSVSGVGGKQINLTLDDSATAQSFVDAINRDTAASRLVTARLVGTSAAGEQTDDVGTGEQMRTSGGGGTPLDGYVTGLAFGEYAGTNLYGVTSAGEFIGINPANGDVTSRVDLTGTFGITGFQGLALGPQTVEAGIYANTLFAISNSGDLVAFDTSGTPANVFDGGVSSISTGIGSPTGLAFSALDFNLWHPTTRRGDPDDLGHGINAPYDLSRTPTAEDRTHTDPQGHTYTLNEGQGGISFYFGLEEYVDSDTNPYLNYLDTRSQFGIPSNVIQRDLTSGAAGNNYNLGAAYGSLITDPFDLVTSTGDQDADDRPTLYFNYFLDTEGRNTATPDGSMRDSARVFISTNGGTAWDLLATNNGNGQLNGSAFRDTTGTTELPSFASHTRFSDTADGRQRVQELHDTANWRQARIDLSDFVGNTGLILRFDFSTFGTIFDPDIPNVNADLATSVDGFGNLDRGDNSYLGGQDNAHEGFYIDDIIIGWSERGEMITGGNNNATSYFSTPDDPDPEAPQLIETGPYQVEIRRGFEHAANVSAADPEISVGFTLDPNVRLIPTDNGVADLGLPPRNDNFDSAPWPAFDPLLGWIPQGLGSTSPWFVLPDIVSGESSHVARSAPYTYTGPGGPIVNPLGDNQNSTMQVTVVTGAGDVTFDYKAIVGTGDAFQVFVDEIGEHPADFEHIDEFDTGWHNGEVAIPVAAGVHTFFFRYTKDGSDPSGPPVDEGVMIDNVNFPVVGGRVLGDKNVVRAQGAFHIESNFVRDAQDVGILVRAGTREGTGGIEDDGPSSNTPIPGSPINFDTQNVLRYAPGVVIQNNVVTGFGNTGIRFAGESNASAGVPAAAVPVGKIINNTLYGAETATGIGIRVQDNAAPIVLNNILAKTATGISLEVDNVSNTQTVLGRNFFYDNNANGTLGNNPIVDPDPATNPLFVDPATNNFYLASGALAIDRSLGSLPDLPAFVSVKTPLAMPNSDAFSPAEDLFGQPRVDDPGQPPSGVGNEVFHDLGAIERADTSQPYATVVVPQDQGLIDDDPSLNEVRVLQDRMTEFVIQLTDVGVGIDDLSVLGSRVHIWRDLDEGTFDYATYLASLGTGTPDPAALVEDSDYLFRYDVVRNRISLIPVLGFWTQGSTYTVLLFNGPEGATDEGIRDLAGNPVLPTGFPDPLVGLTVFKITLAGWDYGDAPDVPWNTYPSRFELGVYDGARHMTSQSATVFLGSGVTREDFSLHNPDASGDSLDDGVRFQDSLAVNTTVDLTVDASTDGFFNAWIDFNGDGDWDDAWGPISEQVFVDEPLTAGPNSLQVTIPDEFDVGLGVGELEKLTFGRFRFSTETGLSYVGAAGDGEVEDYQLRLVRYPEDYGDAPADDGTGVLWYPTLFAQNGASHYLPGSNPFLGAAVDAEADGQPNATATGDDVDGFPNDEDGITWDAPALTSGAANLVHVTLGGLTSAYLDAWIDFNLDGDWDDPGEQIFASQVLNDFPSPVNTLSFNVPAAATSGTSYARFRVSSVGGLSFDGAAEDGEVEDYEVVITQAPVADPDGDPEIIYDVEEGSSIQLFGHASYDPDPGDTIVSWFWDLEIETFPDPVVYEALVENPFYTWYDNDVYDIRLVVADNHGATGEATDQVTVRNVDPTVDVTNPTVPVIVDEGSLASNDGSFADQGLLDVVTITADIGSVGYTYDPGVSSSGVWNWTSNPGDTADNGIQTVTITATDDDGGTATVTFDLIVINVAPVVWANTDPVIVNEGDSGLNLNDGGFSDVGLADVVTITASIGTVVHTPTSSSGVWTWSADPADIEDGDVTQTVVITARDDDGGIGFTTFELIVNNVDPTVSANIDPVIVNEGDTAQNNGSFFDPGAENISITASIGTITGVNQVADTWDWEFDTSDGPDDSQTVTITADDGEATTAITFDLVVLNVAPTAEAGGPYLVDEGDDVTLSASGSTDPGDDTLTYVWDLDGDGVFGETGANATRGDEVGEDVVFSTTDDGVYIVDLRVTDDENALGTDTAQVTVANVAPTADAGGPYSGDEGSDIDLTGAASTDPGLDIDTYHWDLDGDGVFGETGVNAARGDEVGMNVAFNTTDDGVYTVSLRVTDDDGDSDTGTAQVTVNNVAPTANAGGPYTGLEGSDINLTGAASTDPGLDIDTYRWDLDGDGLFGETGANAARGDEVGMDVVFNTTDDGVYTVSLRVTDDDGDSGTATAQVTVNNVAPTADAGGPYTGFEGSDINLTGAASTDPGVDIASYHWDLDDDGVFGETGANATRGDELGLVVAFNTIEDDVYTVSLRVTDDDGASDTTTAQVTVFNVAPTADAGGPYAFGEGGSVLVDASGSTDPGNDIVLYQWDLDGDGAYDDALGVTAVFSSTEDGFYTVGVRVTDNDGDSDTDTATIAVGNVGPVAEAGGPYFADEGSDVTLDASASVDPGNDIASWHWDFDGDGLYDDASGETVVFNSTDDGIFTVRVRVTDDDGAFDTDAATVTVYNVAPTAEAGGPYFGTEGSDITLIATASDDPGLDIDRYEWDFDGDGQYDDATGVTVTFNSTDDGLFTVGLRVTDDDGASDTDTTTVDVVNVAPTADAGGPYFGNEGANILLDGSGSTDPGGDIVAYEWDLDGNGSFETPGVNPLFNSTADGVFVVALRVTDEDGEWNVDTAQVTVYNVGPTADAGGPYTGNEGSDITLDGSGSTDPGLDIVLYQWDFDSDGLYDDATGVNPVFNSTVDNLFPGHTVRLRVEDANGAWHTDTATVVVSNVAPTAEAGGPYVGNEGSGITLDGSGSTDPGLDIASYRWDLDGDGLIGETGAAAARGDEVGIAPTFSTPVDGGYVVRLVVTDDDGASHFDTASVTVNNVAPTADAGGPYTGNEGSDITVSAAASTDPGLDIDTYHWDLDGDGLFGETGANATSGDEVGMDVLFNTTDDGVHTVAVRVTDDGGASDTASATVTVANVGPTAEAGGTYYVDEEATVELDGSGSTDPGDDIVSYLWDFDGDGDYDDASGIAPTFSAAGIDGPVSLTVGLRVVDHRGLTSDDTATLWVVEPLGPVDFLEMSGLNVSGGDLWYSLETTHEAFLTIISLDFGAFVTVYDKNAVPFLPATTPRADVEVGAGERYLFRVSGAGIDVGLRLANLVHQAGSNVTVYGTDDEDLFEFDAGASRLVTINQVPYHFTDAEAIFTSFDGAAAGDTAILDGNSQNETAELWPDHGTLDGPGYALTLANTETVTFHGGGGRNVARLHGSPQDDFLDAKPNQATLSDATLLPNGTLLPDATFEHKVYQVRNVFAYAENGGVDTGVLQDLPGAKDTFIGKPTHGEMYDGATYYNYAGGFERLTGSATLGVGYDDLAQVYDGVGNDVFNATPNEGTMTFDGVPNHFVAATGFKMLVGYGTGGGLNTANLQDSPNSRDLFIGKPTDSVLHDGTPAEPLGGSFYLSTVGFQQTNAAASPGLGFNDQARLHDGVGHDVYNATPEEATLNYNGNPINFVHATGFRSTIGYATSGGIDVANLQDSPDTRDIFIANPAWAKLYHPGTFYEAVVGFEQTIATASAVTVTSVGDVTSTTVGFPDKAKLFDGVGDDVFEAAPNTGTLYFNGSPNNFIRALAFRSVLGYGRGGGMNSASLQDAVTKKDTFTGYETWGKLEDGATHYEAAFGFDQLTATASAGAGFSDKALLYDGPDPDVFDATPAEGTLKFNGDPNRFIKAAGFRSVINFAENGGIDNANLQDSPASKDYFFADPTYGRLDDRATFYLAAIGHEHVSASATPGTVFSDEAELHDSYTSDEFEASPDHAQYTYTTGNTVRANHFRDVVARSREAHSFPDTATLTSQPGSPDTFTGLAASSTMEGGDYSVEAWYFDSLTAVATAGDGDIAHLVGSNSDYEYFEGTLAHPVYGGSHGRLYGFGFDNEVIHFDEIYADAGAPGIMDRAFLSDSALEDLLTLNGNTATLQRVGAPTKIEVAYFDYLMAESTTQGDDDTVNDLGHLFDLDLEGWWENL